MDASEITSKISYFTLADYLLPLFFPSIKYSNLRAFITGQQKLNLTALSTSPLERTYLGALTTGHPTCNSYLHLQGHNKRRFLKRHEVDITGIILE